jgi:hypothetical protein
MTNREALRAPASGATIVGLFRDALRIKLALRDKLSSIEDIVGDAGGLDSLLDDYGSCCSGIVDVHAIESADIVAEIEKILEDPDAEVIRDDANDGEGEES